jgi:hypothetical protein
VIFHLIFPLGYVVFQVSAILSITLGVNCSLVRIKNPWFDGNLVQPALFLHRKTKRFTWEGFIGGKDLLPDPEQVSLIRNICSLSFFPDLGPSC